MANTTHERGSPGARQLRAIALLVCDRLIRDDVTGHVSLIDLIDDVLVREFPVTAACAVYARLTDAEGAYRLMIDVVRRDDVLEVAKTDVVEFEATDPLEDGEVLVRRVELPLPSAGWYDFRMWVNGRFVHGVSLRAGVRMA